MIISQALQKFFFQKSSIPLISYSTDGNVSIEKVGIKLSLFEI